MAGLGDNELKALKGTIDDIVQLERDKKEAQKYRKEEISGLKAAGLPAKQLVELDRQSREDAEKLKEEREKVRLAAAVLGMKAFVAEAEALAPDAVPAKDKVSYARSALAVIREQDEEIAGIAEEIKERYVQVKAMGVDAGIVRRIVKHMLNPEDLDARDAQDALFMTYLANLNKVKVEEPEKEDEETY